MSKILFFNFDGTGNEPKDAVQDTSANSEVEDNNITNILKFHLLLGGDLKSKNTPINSSSSRSFYYNGVGTYGNNPFKKVMEMAVAGDDVATIINRGLKDFDKYYTNDVKKIVVTGFSRGGAIARRFAALINDKVPRKMVIEGIFDTVASIGLPNLSTSDRPKSNVVFEHGHTLLSDVEKALHLVSLDEKRRHFQPTLMNKDERVLEVWFAGAHSDIGGGYFYDGLSDTCLRFFLDWFEELGLGINFLTPKNIKYAHLTEKNAGFTIGVDDVQVDADSFGVNHQQESFIKAMFLTNRRCCVIQKDEVMQKERPLVYCSVAERISGNRNYKPKSLKNVEHKILYPDGKSKEFSGYSEHKQMYKCKFHILNPRDEAETFIFSHKKFNHTGIMFEKDKSYQIEVVESGNYKWNDGGLKKIDGEGWNRKDVKLGFNEIFIAVLEPFRRVANAKWFSLCGSIGDNDDTAFYIGNKQTYKSTKSGEFCAFANDLDGYYGNNTGKLKIKVTCL